MKDYDISLWRNYPDRKVGIRLPGKPPKFLKPDEARDMAREMEAEFTDAELDKGDHRDFLADLREYADDVEDADG